ncbi:phosphoenolpyruvate carboxykinase (ATP) [Jeotgalibaca sp. MA1X17-3]|uniref:phosphoenolpyruvate carboxykinase (ATP) n=1 Tax=Jeotgalibaca sp. MA1X17-3 TaxID=2908211 RepID=UPI001F1FE6E4|nr:phosphoenolpyruvate carboxykinase (ATP) [Jeotgalibaca sp. MA1X17-3]UJF14799.1 phosphoenolpyruvate carboxykinase (ATP) [Jeotgalibaca sp. MA1X17-3]
MATIERFEKSDLKKSNPLLSKFRTTIETAFYGNNMVELLDVAKAYHLSLHSDNTIVTDLPVLHTKELGLPDDAKILVENGGKIFGRTAQARRIVGENKEEDNLLEGIIRDVIYHNSHKKYYKTTGYVGLDPDFMVKAHIAFPEGYENNLYSWLLNFQSTNPQYNAMYKDSISYPDGDIYIYADPDWTHPDYPMGLAYFEPDRNVACILGMQYFGEFKKGTLTLAWATGHRNHYVACHGGQKSFHIDDGSTYVASFFGLSGSGKSTLTHAKHENKYEIKVLHDDAFLINLKDGSSIALEPSYFDKTQDYPADHPEQNYFVTVQNVGVTLDVDGNKVLVTEDIRNGNGRTVKSRYSTPNRVDKFTDPINAVYWIMKDESMPPLVKISDPVVGATFGATLATKRTSAENIKKGESADQLVIEPYANPFRVYPLSEDFKDFTELLNRKNMECYIINTGYFLDKKIPKEITLQAIEEMVEKTGEFLPFGEVKGMSYLSMEGFQPDFTDSTYKKLVKERMDMRLEFLETFNKSHPDEPLPIEAIQSVKEIIDSL